MNKITLEEVSQNLIDYLRRAQAGESFVIFQDERPLAKISSVASDGILEAFDAFRSANSSLKCNSLRSLIVKYLKRSSIVKRFSRTIVE